MPPSHTTPPPNDNARNMAANTLLAFHQRGAYVQDTLDAIFRARPQLEARQKRQAAELALGACRHLITLDHLISRHSKRPLRRIDPLVLQTLRLGLYQLLYLAAAPDFAVISEAVDQAKTYGPTGSHAFVNALLRTVQRSLEETAPAEPDGHPQRTLWIDDQTRRTFKNDLFPHPDRQPVKFFATTLAHPPWLVERWLKRYDPPTVRALCLADNARPPLQLRVNRLLCTAEDLAGRLRDAGIGCRCTGDTVQLDPSAGPEPNPRLAPQQLPGYPEGLFTVQDAGAAAVAPLLDPQPDWCVLDLCAAPGGKTTHLAELMNNQGRLLACDRFPQKLDLITENCRRLGITTVETCLADQLDQAVRTLGPFDAVLADVPCSNTGVLARRVEARHLLKPAAITELTRLQRQLLDRAAAALKPQGRLLYSTCSIEPAENHLLIREFLDTHPDFTLVSERLLLPGGLTLESPTARSATAHLQTLWHDGGYTALLQKP